MEDRCLSLQGTFQGCLSASPRRLEKKSRARENIGLVVPYLLQNVQPGTNDVWQQIIWKSRLRYANLTDRGIRVKLVFKKGNMEDITKIKGMKDIITSSGVIVPSLWPMHVAEFHNHSPSTCRQKHVNWQVDLSYSLIPFGTFLLFCVQYLSYLIYYEVLIPV